MGLYEMSSMSVYGQIAGALALCLATLPADTPSIRGAMDQAQPILVHVDSPSSGAAISGSVRVWGSALDSSAAGAIDRVSLYLNGAFVKDAVLGIARDDIAAEYGDAYRTSGWQVDLELDALVSPGLVSLTVNAHSAPSDATASVVQPFTMFESRRFGVNAHLLRVAPARAAVELDRATAAGIRLVRFDINWDEFEPTARGELNARATSLLDNALEQMAARGIRPIAVVLRTPAWARHESGTPMTPPDDPQDFANFLNAIASRYASRNLTYEVWNEPNDYHFWDAPAGPDPVAYTRLLQAAYVAIKSVSPWSTVLGGSLTFNDAGYLAEMYKAGASGSFDGLAIHPYSQEHAPDSVVEPYYSFALAIQNLPRVMAANHDAHKSLWITEMGWSTRHVSDDDRAVYFERAVEIVRAQPQIAAFCAYALDQANTDMPDFGMITPEGIATASWNAYTQAAATR